MLAKADVVGVASLRKESYQWQVRFSKVLKGKALSDVWIPLNKPLSLDLDMFGKMVGKDSFLFLAYDRQANGHLLPAYWLVSAWPQGNPRDSRLETLEGCIKFAETVLAGQAAEGENTMTENAVLPPMLSETKLKELRDEEAVEASRKFGLRSPKPIEPSTEKNTPFDNTLQPSSRPAVVAEVVSPAEPTHSRGRLVLVMTCTSLLILGGCYYFLIGPRRK